MENTEEVAEEEQPTVEESSAVIDVDNQEAVMEMATEDPSKQTDELLNLEADRIEEEETPKEEEPLDDVQVEDEIQVDDIPQEEAVVVPEEPVVIDEETPQIVIVADQPEVQECPEPPLNESINEALEKNDIFQPEEVKSPLVIVNELWNQPRRSTVKMPDPSQLDIAAPPPGPFLHKCPYCDRQFEMRSNMIRHIKYKFTYLPKIKSISATLHFPADKTPQCCTRSH